MQDITTKKGCEFSKTFYDIKAAGGIHDYLGFYIKKSKREEQINISPSKKAPPRFIYRNDLSGFCTNFCFNI